MANYVDELFREIRRLSPGASPNEGFPGNATITSNNLGLSDESRAIRHRLSMMQAQGIRPPMQNQSGSMKYDIMRLFRLLSEIGLGETWPDTGQERGQGAMIDAGLTDGTYGGSLDLLRRILAGEFE